MVRERLESHRQGKAVLGLAVLALSHLQERCFAHVSEICHGHAAAIWHGPFGAYKSNGLTPRRKRLGGIRNCRGLAAARGSKTNFANWRGTRGLQPKRGAGWCGGPRHSRRRDPNRDWSRAEHYRVQATRTNGPYGKAERRQMVGQLRLPRF